MKKLLALLIVLTVSFSTFAQVTKWRDKEMEVKVTINNKIEAKTLTDLKLNGDIYTMNGYALMYVVPKEFEKIKATGLKYEILKKDLNEYYMNFWNQDVPAGYFTYQQIVDLADSLTTAFPSICKKISFGTSAGGYQLCALKISDNAVNDENEAEVMFDAGIHGDEVGGPQNVMLLARELCKGYGSNSTYTNLINTREIWFYYMVNPDGRVNMVRYNANGIDCNRNWYYMWDNECGTGSPNSQPETKALYDCMYNNQFVVHTSYHSGTEFISYPWSYRANQSPDNTHINYLASIYATNSGYTNIPYAPGYTGMYPINGSSKDANYALTGSISWSIEISNDKQPAANMISTYYNYNKPAMLKMIEYAGYGIEGVVTAAGSGTPISASIFVNNFYPSYTDPVVGDYHKYLTAGTYTLKVVANGYQTQTINNVVVSNLASTITNIQMQPLQKQYAFKLVGCQIPGNNFSDEGTTFACIGAPDNINYSIGKNGWVIVDMQTPVTDGIGNDVKIFEGDATPEGYTLYAGPSFYGPWVSIGTGNGSTEFDFAGKIASAQYIKIVDDGDGSSTGADIGFDFDAAEALVHTSGVYITMLGYTISDPLPGGNNNGRIDPNETVTITVNLKNNGDITANSTTGTLSVTDPYVILGSTTLNYNNIEPGATAQASFTLTTANNAPLGHPFIVYQTISANSGSYSISKNINLTIGTIVEDWETNTFTKFPWNFGGNANWTLTNVLPYEGLYCAKSGTIGSSSSTILQINYNVANNDSISFYRKVSSESGYDFLNFWIDGTTAESWSGNISWSKVKYPVTQGPHIFKWEYTKDGSATGGSDCAWIDYIVFPSPSPDNITEIQSEEGFYAYPNPVNKKLTITYNIGENEMYDIRLLSSLGNTVYSEKNNYTSDKTIDVSNLGAGVYILIIENNKKVFTKKIIIQK